MNLLQRKLYVLLVAKWMCQAVDAIKGIRVMEKLVVYAFQEHFSTGKNAILASSVLQMLSKAKSVLLVVPPTHQYALVMLGITVMVSHVLHAKFVIRML